MGGKPFPGVDADRRRLMAGIGRENTAPEVAVRRMLHSAGLRFRLHVRNLPGTPDVVLPGRRVAVFVHGCFWHRHDCRAGRVPRTRSDYWEAKLSRNVARDAQAKLALEASGWTVVVIWECHVRQPERMAEIVGDIAALPLRRRAGTK